MARRTSKSFIAPPSLSFLLLFSTSTTQTNNNGKNIHLLSILLLLAYLPHSPPFQHSKKQSAVMEPDRHPTWDLVVGSGSVHSFQSETPQPSITTTTAAVTASTPQSGFPSANVTPTHVEEYDSTNSNNNNIDSSRNEDSKDQSGYESSDGEHIVARNEEGRVYDALLPRKGSSVRDVNSEGGGDDKGESALVNEDLKCQRAHMSYLYQFLSKAVKRFSPSTACLSRNDQEYAKADEKLCRRVRRMTSTQKAVAFRNFKNSRHEFYVSSLTSGCASVSRQVEQAGAKDLALILRNHDCVRYLEKFFIPLFLCEHQRITPRHLANAPLPYRNPRPIYPLSPKDIVLLTDSVKHGKFPEAFDFGAPQCINFCGFCKAEETECGGEISENTFICMFHPDMILKDRGAKWKSQLFKKVHAPQRGSDIPAKAIASLKCQTLATMAFRFASAASCTWLSPRKVESDGRKVTNITLSGYVGMLSMFLPVFTGIAQIFDKGDKSMDSIAESLLDELLSLTSEPNNPFNMRAARVEGVAEMIRTNYDDFTILIALNIYYLCKRWIQAYHPEVVRLENRGFVQLLRLRWAVSISYMLLVTVVLSRRNAHVLAINTLNAFADAMAREKEQERKQ